jgi:hypothetical protein
VTFTLSAVGGEIVPVAPGAVTTLAAAPRDNAAHLTWAPPATSGSAPVTGYTITATSGGMVRRYTATSTATTLDLGQLVNDFPWDVTVVPATIVGPGPAATATVIPTATAGPADSPVAPAITAPGAPVLLTVDAGADGARVTWSAPVDNGGSPITAYHFVAVGPDGGTVSVYTPPAEPLSAVLRPLTNDVTWSVTVAAVNAAGEGATSNALATTPTAAGPDVGPATGGGGAAEPVYVPPPQPTLWAFPATYPLAPAFFLTTADEAETILAGSTLQAVTGQ